MTKVHWERISNSYECSGKTTRGSRQTCAQTVLMFVLIALGIHLQDLMSVFRNLIMLASRPSDSGAICSIKVNRSPHSNKMEEWHYSNTLHTRVGHMLSTCTHTVWELQMSGKERRPVSMETSGNWLQKPIGLQGEVKQGPIRSWRIYPSMEALCTCKHGQWNNPLQHHRRKEQRNWLTNELLVSNVQSHVPQSCGHGTNHPVIVYPQQLHQDRKTLLFPNCSADIDRPLDRTEGWVWIIFSSFLNDWWSCNPTDVWWAHVKIGELSANSNSLLKWYYGIFDSGGNLYL